jgi:hypothetical protein
VQRDHLQAAGLDVQLPQQRRHRGALVRPQGLLGEPAASFVAEQVRRGAAWHQVAVRDRMYLVVAPSPLPNRAGSADHLPAQRVGGRVR